MDSSHRTATCVALVALAGAARPCAAADPAAARVLLWFCDDEALEGTGFPGCEATGEALRIEMETSALDVVDGEGVTPGDPRRAAEEGGAIFVAWVEEGVDGTAYVLLAYDALNGQLVSKEVLRDEDAPPDADAVAFLYRNMLGTSLYADLDSIEMDSDLWSLTFPDEKVQTFKEVEGIVVEPAPPPPPSVYLHLSYQPVVMVMAPAAWHLASFGVSGRVHRMVELSVDLGGSPGPLTRERDGVTLDLHLVDVMASVKVLAFHRGMVSLLPSAGFGLQVSIVDMRGAFIEGTDRQSRSDVHGSVFASLLGRFMFHRIVGLVIELGLDILLNYERFEVGPGDGGEEIFDYGRVGLFGRVGVVFGL